VIEFYKREKQQTNGSRSRELVGIIQSKPIAFPVEALCPSFVKYMPKKLDLFYLQTTKWFPKWEKAWQRNKYLEEIRLITGLK